MTYSKHITVKGERKLSLLPHLMVMFLVFGIGLVAGFALGTWWASPHRQQGRPQTTHEFLCEVERHVSALRDCGLPWQVDEYNDGHVRVSTLLPGIEGVGRVFQRYGDD